MPTGASATSDATAFESFYREQYDKTARLAWFLTRGSFDYEDIAQDALFKVRDRFATLGKPAAYLRVVVVNACNERHRRMDRESARLRLVAPSELVLTPSDAGLLDVLKRLPYDQRAVIVLRYWADLSDDDIAAALGIRPSTVRTRVHRALKVLNKEIER